MSTHSLTKATLRAEGLPRRRAVNRLMELTAWLAAAVAVAILGVVVWSVARRGAGALDLDLLTKTPVPFDFGSTLLTFLSTFLIGVGVHFGLWKPTGAAVALQRIGSPRQLPPSTRD